MKTVNHPIGMTVVPADAKERAKWYRWWAFPLVPLFEYRSADDWNEARFNFSWLNFCIWSMMSPDIGFEIKLEDIGFYIKIHIPYLIINVWLMRFPFSWHQKLWRVGKKSRSSMRGDK